MFIIKRTLARVTTALLGLAPACSVLAAEPAPIQPTPYARPWPWHPMPWPPFWWIFPLMFFIMMIVVIGLMIRGSRMGWGCMWRDRMMGSPGLRDAMDRSLRAPAESALEILNKRYAKGAIDKQEYEEKKAAIIRPE